MAARPARPRARFTRARLNIGATTTLNAIAYASGYADSTVASGSYTIGSSSTWALTWSDEFNGQAGSVPDSSKWNYDVGGGGWW